MQILIYFFVKICFPLTLNLRLASFKVEFSHYFYQSISCKTLFFSFENKLFSRPDNSVIIQWDSDTTNILGFRVVYRLFGDKTFKQGPPLESTEREFKIKNVPNQECIVVCVVSLEEIAVTPENVPHSQCREVRTIAAQTSNMDKITIAASAAICGTIIVAVIIFIAASR